MFLLALSYLFVFQTRWTIQLYLHCVEWSFAFSRYVEQWQEGAGSWSRTRRTHGCGKHFTPSSNILPWESHRFREEFYNFQGKNRLSRIHSNLISIFIQERVVFIWTGLAANCKASVLKDFVLCFHPTSFPGPQPWPRFAVAEGDSFFVFI